MWLWTGPAGTGRAGMAGRSANGDGWVTLGLAGRGWGERDPLDGSLPGSPVPGILQARTLEWVAISSALSGDSQRLPDPA